MSAPAAVTAAGCLGFREGLRAGLAGPSVSSSSSDSLAAFFSPWHWSLASPSSVLATRKGQSGPVASLESSSAAWSSTASATSVGAWKRICTISSSSSLVPNTTTSSGLQPVAAATPFAKSSEKSWGIGAFTCSTLVSILGAAASVALPCGTLLSILSSAALVALPLAVAAPVVVLVVLAAAGGGSCVVLAACVVLGATCMACTTNFCGTCWWAWTRWWLWPWCLWWPVLCLW
mmetsp:Transcript_25905/g.82289  ORF Transcript_25905/g.82289 Transcript_25905/m.82289 type:complete len:233 (-) Transcript_25905:85-783(-)